MIAYACNKMIICVLKQNNRLGPNFAAIKRPLIKGLKHLMCPKHLICPFIIDLNIKRGFTNFLN